MRILAIDPGGTTGWATYDTETREGEGGVIVGHEWEHVDRVVQMVLEWRLCDVLVLEDFQLRTDLHEGAKHRKETLSPVRLNAMIEYTLYREALRHLTRIDGLVGGAIAGVDGSGVDRRWATEPGRPGSFIVKQAAADAKRFATDERLKRWGLYITPEHARDAMRHALLYAAKHRDEAQAGEEVRRGAGAAVRGTRVPKKRARSGARRRA